MISVKLQFFLSSISGDNLDKKKSLSRLKEQAVKKFKKLAFSKGVRPRFWSKNLIFHLFILGNIGKEKVFGDILD